MKFKYLHRVKWYVVGTIVVIIIVARYIVVDLKNNAYLTPSFAIESFNAYKYELDFQNSIREASTQSTTTSALDDLGVDYSKSIPTLVYHGEANIDLSTKFTQTTAQFKDQMFALKRAGYTSITTEDLASYLKGQINLPPKSILITFDDGRVDAVNGATPVLQAIGYKATMFTIGRYSLLGERQKYYLSSEQLKQISDRGIWDIEAHSYDGHSSYFTAPGQLDGHFFSHKQWVAAENRLETDREFTDRVETDMAKVKAGLAQLIGKPVDSFAYPYGDYGQNNTNFKDAVAINLQALQKNYSLAFYQINPTKRFTNSYYIEENAHNPLFMVRRIIIESNWTGQQLLDVLKTSVAKTLPFRDNFMVNKGWMVLWGHMDLANGLLSLTTEPGETGSTIILDGTRLWTDYSVVATIASPNKSNVYIWTRFKDDDNNAACNFGDGFIHIEQTLNGTTTVIKGVISKKLAMPRGDFTVEARVKARDISCILNGRTVVETPFLDSGLDSGGIGFKTWERTANMANLNIKNVVVEQI